MRVHTLLMLALLLVGPRVRAAEKKPVLVNLAGPKGEPLVRALLRDHAHDFRHPPQAMKQALLSGGAEAQRRPLDLNAARTAYSQFDYAKAKVVLEEAQQALLAEAPRTGLEQAIRDIAFWMGVVAHAQAKPSRATRWFRLVLRMDERYAVDAVRFNPGIQKAFLAARNGRPPQKITVSLRAEPADARLTIDGKTALAGKVALEKGLHLVALRKPGRSASARIIEVKQGLSIAIDATKLPAPRAAHHVLGWAQRASSGGPRLALLAHLEPFVGQSIAAIELLHGRLAARLYHLGRRTHSELIPLEGEGTTKLVEALRRRVLTQQIAGAATQPAPRKKERSIWSRWPLWAGIGAAVVAGVVVSSVLLYEPSQNVVCCQ